MYVWNLMKSSFTRSIVCTLIDYNSILFDFLAQLPKQPSPGLITWKYIHQKVPWSLIFLLGE